MSAIGRLVPEDVIGLIRCLHEEERAGMSSAFVEREQRAPCRISEAGCVPGR
jgi:hypothetical protein